MATSRIPLILIPQILFCGLVGIPTGVSKVVGVLMPATWCFDEMKDFRGSMFSKVRTRKHNRRELYKQIERDNDRNIEDSRAKVDKNKADAEKSISNFEKKMEDYQKDLAMGRAVKKPTATKLSQKFQLQKKFQTI